MLVLQRSAPALERGHAQILSTVEMKLLTVLLLIIVSIMLVISIDGLTNAQKIENCSWDCKYYLALAEDGFDADPLLAPYAYRYATPFLARGIHSLLDVPAEQGFRIIAYIGAVLQLTGVYLLVKQVTSSSRGAFLALLITGFSFYNLKFLLFDVSRPEHLVFPLMLLQTYLGFKDRFWLLLLTTLLGLQFREFAVLPLLSYLVMILPIHERRAYVLRYLLPALGVLLVGILLPRILIHASASVQYIDFSVTGINKALSVPFKLRRNLNIIYTTIAYLLPSCMVVSSARVKSVISLIPSRIRLFLLSYTVFVLLFTMYGGTDLPRFTAYLFIPQSIFIGAIASMIAIPEMAAMLAATFTFNRVWATIPFRNMDEYFDFYGGYHSRVNLQTVKRALEWLVFVVLGQLIRKTTANKLTSD